MGFNWKDYLQLAKSLFAPLKSISGASTLIDARLRSAVSRAYYAAYNQALAYTKSECGYTPGKSKDNHHGVRMVLKSCPKTVALAEVLGQLHWWRKRADYDGTFADLKEKASRAIKDAQKCIDELPVAR